VEGSPLSSKLLHIFIVSFLAGCYLHGLRPERVEGGYLFSLKAPGAQGAALAGSFNNWSETASPMNGDSNGLWKIVIPLKRGRYRYMFIIFQKDGKREWIEPPGAQTYVPDGFGGRNGVICVEME